VAMKTYIKSGMLVLPAVLLLACSKTPENRVTVKQDANAVTYSIQHNSCTVIWEYLKQSHSMKQTSTCASPDEQATMVRELLNEFRKDGQKLDSLAGIEVDPKEAGISFRMALAVHRFMGGCRKTTPYDSIEKAFNDADILKELREPFESAGVRLKVGSLEKVSMMPASQLPFYDQLEKQGVRSNEILPYDCWLWLVRE
jgi:hypothetical protein